MEEAIKKKGIAESMDMTTGSLWKKIFLFSMPLMASQILQVLFNMADIAVVGTFSSSQAMGSVGSTSILVTLFTGFLIGLGSGVNVKVAQQLGAKQEKEAKQTVHTSLIICTAAGAIITVLCLLLARQMLELIDNGATNVLRLQPFGCLPNHITGKGVMKELKRLRPAANLMAVDYDPGSSEANQLNRIKLFMSMAHAKLQQA